MKKTALFSFGATLLVPILALAQTFNPNYIDSIIDKGTGWLNTALTVVMVLMTLFFLISVLRYIMEKDAGKLAERRKVMLNGVIGLFVALSVWGIIAIAGNILGTRYNSGPVQTVCPPGMVPFGATCR